LQPKTQVWSPGLIYVGATLSVSCTCSVSIFADDLANPIISELTLHVEATERAYANQEIIELARKK
jgi:hypothetical protein